MTKMPIKLQDLRRKIYTKAKAEPEGRFWGIYVHVCKKETLEEAYKLTKKSNGAPGIDGVTFESIEAEGLEKYLQQIRHELITKTYSPNRNRRKEIPKVGGKLRTLNIPCIRDRIVQNALKLIIEPIFESDFQDGSYGYRPKKQAHEAVDRIEKAAIKGNTKCIDVDLKAYFDNVRHHILMEKIAKRINDKEIMHLIKLILKVGGKRGIAQGSPISPLLSNIYLNEVDKMLEKAKEVTKDGKYQRIEYARWADDLVILTNGHQKWEWLEKSVHKRLQEELAKLEVEVNKEKTKVVNLKKGETFSFLGFDFRQNITRQGKWNVRKTPKMKARTSLLQKLKEVFRCYKSQPIERVIHIINPILRGWINYFRIGNSSRSFGYIKDWVEKKVRRNLMQARKAKGFGWERWSKEWIYETLGLYADYRVRYHIPKMSPVQYVINFGKEATRKA
ncbi:group II intron reverse transcriptase/maturase [Wolbachia endosymbiont of Psylliodes chrysocephala]|uniref:group II intron reverse transcriptase/maturase n=1 Tax=Wolbachia endosymbiont of Psylliodes chrysocephala TaxID=2883236 RepID=UPI0020A0ED02|nr:group II intron reverse transcriptase/maturase [Wolbachia endosymbiont of Psylliodes chrysocephala]